MAIFGWKFLEVVALAASYGAVHFHYREDVWQTFYLLSAVITSLWILFVWFLWPIWFCRLARLPTPKHGHLLNGHWWVIFWSGFGEMERRWIREIPNKGFIYYRSIMNTPRLIVTGPDEVQELCVRVDEFIKAPPAKGLALRILGEGLVLSELEKHKQQRRVFLPIFAPRHIREMFPIFWGKSCEVTQLLTHKITEIKKNDPKAEAVFEIGHWASRAALDIVTLATLGEDFGSIQDENAPLAETYRRAVEPQRGYVIMALLKIWLPEWFVDMAPNRWNRTLNECVPVFRNVCRRLLRERRGQVLAQEKGDNSQAILTGGKDLLSLCFRYEEVTSADEESMIDQMSTFLAAGHETIAVGLTWSIYMLCVHPEWQQILRDEARAHLPDPNSMHVHLPGATPSPGDILATSEDIDKMPLLQAFIMEIMRWYPPVPQTMRQSLKDTYLNGQYIPKEAWIIVPIKGINRDVRYWGPDAHSFNPRRWLNPDGSINLRGSCNNKYANLSFMQGSRSCIGKEFARAETACLLASWIGRFHFELVDPSLHDEDKVPITIGSFSGRPLHGLDVKWTIVDGWNNKS